MIFNTTAVNIFMGTYYIHTIKYIIIKDSKKQFIINFEKIILNEIDFTEKQILLYKSLNKENCHYNDIKQLGVSNPRPVVDFYAALASI